MIRSDSSRALASTSSRMPSASARRVVADPGRLGAGLGQLLLVLLEERVGLGLALLGPLDAALDRVDPRLERLLHPREDELHQHEAEHRERDRRR